MRNFSTIKLGDVLEERQEKISPKEANENSLQRVSKIDFKGNIHLSLHKDTKTNMIKVMPGDLLISGINVSKGALSFYHGINPVTATIHYSSYSVRSQKINPIYLKWYLKSNAFKKAIDEQVRGGIKTEIKSKLFLPIEINIHSSLAEQEKIAEKITSTANKISRLQKLKCQNIALINILQNKVFTEAYNSAEKAGKIYDLIELIKEKPRNGYSPKPVDYETPCKSLTLSATTSGYFDGSYSKFIDEEINPSSHLWLNDGDILIQRGNSMEYVGVSAIYRGAANSFIYPDLMMKIVPKQLIFSEYLHLMLMSNQVRSYFRENASGTSGSMPKINQGTVMKSPIPYIDLDMQKEIIQISQRRLGMCNDLANEISSGVRSTNGLLEALLDDIFMRIL
ncbi:TPA: hypothetical protein JBB95_03435 [Legionella pneumophila subsp. pneumophila]|nr:hypothetical protein [Legionella pneumophila subsp. pneumophila]